MTDIEERERAALLAVLYAMRCGCFFPVPMPQAPCSTEALIQWGAMRHLHNTVAALNREVTHD